MTERSESERAELVALADHISAHLKHATSPVLGSKDMELIITALRRLAAPDHGGADAGVNELASRVAIWLRGALDCNQWHWDHDQREMAESDYKAFMAAISKATGGAS